MKNLAISGVLALSALFMVLSASAEDSTTTATQNAGTGGEAGENSAADAAADTGEEAATADAAANTASTPIVPAKLEPFGLGAKLPASREIKPAKVGMEPVDCLSPEHAKLWSVELALPDTEDKLFSFSDDNGTPVLNIAAGLLDPARTTVRILLPGNGPANGDVWAKNKASFVSFLCRSSKPAAMTFHLLLRGKTPGTYQTGFSAQPGDWQRVVLPISEFKLKNFGNVAGFAVRSAEAGEDCTVSIKDISVGGAPFSDDSWKHQRFSISINGDWRFRRDSAEEGKGNNWFAANLDDAGWSVLRSGQSWQQQGVNHYGWGWYRQNMFIPQELAGVPLTLNLTSIPSDDDVWINGVHIGGIHGEYKYKNLINRAYVIPAGLIRYGQENSIALRIWGGRITFIGDNSGLIKGNLRAEFDPYLPLMRQPGGEAVPFPLFDLSDAQRGKEFEIVMPFPAVLVGEGGAFLNYRLTDYTGRGITAGCAPLTVGEDGLARAVLTIDRQTAQTIYLRGRFRAGLVVEDAAGVPQYTGIREFDNLSFAGRDNKPLPELPEQFADTPYGKLRLIDEIDCATSVFDSPHPYLQGGFVNELNHMTPGSASEVKVVDILGKKARESEYGWFAYRIGRGKLKPRSQYLLRIEYPEDKPRYAPIEIQTGQNFMGLGWKTGIAPDDVYDNWPLSGKWEWHDVIVPLDDQTVGTGGVGSAPGENGFWVYFLNKRKPGQYYALWEGGPAVARIQLYEIDPVKNAPQIRLPEGLPQRVLAMDWERQADHDPQDLVRYAKLMGYNAISPIMLKWSFANYGEPINGYGTNVIDAQNYWAHIRYEPGSGIDAASPYPQRKSQHALYLEATKQWGINYIPRVEWGGSMDLPEEARALDPTGKPTKPNRFAPWCANLLHPATWDDMARYVEYLMKPHFKDNPQLAGMLWRIRCSRMPISYGPRDIELFAQETGTPLPGGRYEQWSAWVTGEAKTAYETWWHQKRADFHIRLSKLLQSYDPKLMLYYHNWDSDKFGIIEPDLTAWAFVSKVVKAGPQGGREEYLKERTLRKTFTAQDYIHVLHTGNFGNAFAGFNRADLGIRPELYANAPGIQLFAPAHYLCYADMPEYLEYFRTKEGLAVSNMVSYDEIGSRTIHPKYECNELIPAGAAYSMAMELLPYFHGDARTLNFTTYTYGRGFADAHRRFAQAFLTLPAISGKIVQTEDDLRVRTYPSQNGTYVGVAYKGYAPRKLSIRVPADKDNPTVEDLVLGQTVPARREGENIVFDVESGPVELNAYLIH